MKTRGIVSELDCKVMNTHTMVSDIHGTIVKVKGPEESDGKNLSVNDTRAVTTESILTDAQNLTRSETPTTIGSNVSYLHLVYLANHLPRRRGPVSDVAS